ncbi:hypothetical protein LCGC14_1977750, partial [marine sediment metagenome]
AQDDYQPDEADDEFDADAEDDEPGFRMDEVVRRALRCALFGLLFWPLQLYSLWLLVRLALHGAPLGSANRRRVLIAFLLDLPPMVFCVVMILDIF